MGLSSSSYVPKVFFEKFVSPPFFLFGGGLNDSIYVQSAGGVIPVVFLDDLVSATQGLPGVNVLGVALRINGVRPLMVWRKFYPPASDRINLSFPQAADRFSLPPLTPIVCSAQYPLPGFRVYFHAL
jgi:hypothetical protein